jgi:hypothetical protein
LLPAILLLVEVNTDIDTLVALHVDAGLRQQLIFCVLQIRDEDIVRPCGWNANGKLAAMVGNSLPTNFFSLARRSLRWTPYRGCSPGPHTVPKMSA